MFEIRAEKNRSLIKYFEIDAKTDPGHPIGKAGPVFLLRKAADIYPLRMAIGAFMLRNSTKQSSLFDPVGIYEL